MGKLGDMIKAIIDKPDDLSMLPEIVEKVNVLETSEAGLLDRVAALQEVNRKYLQMIIFPKRNLKAVTAIQCIDWF